MKRAIVIFLLVCPVAAARTQVVVPVATARYKDRIYSTTIAFKNASPSRVAQQIDQSIAANSERAEDPLAGRTSAPDAHGVCLSRPIGKQMRNVISVAISCRRCRCRAIYSGPLDVNRTTECAECRHPLIGDHGVKVSGVADPANQFAAIPPSSDRF